MKKSFSLWAMGVIFILASVFWGSPAFAGIPHLINYQGMLTDNSGHPLTDTVNVVFKIYDNSSGGNLKWQETQNNVPVINGLFNVILGSVTPIDTLSFSQQYWLDITVDGELMPNRLKFTSVGYAYRAQRSDTASVAISAPSGGGWTDDGANVRLTTSTDKVGIGIPSPLGKLHINTSGWDAAHLYLETPSYGHSRILQASDGLLLKNFYSTGTATAFSFRNPTDVHLLDIRADGNVGIGMSAPSEKLQVAGMVYSSSGGFKFPDGTTQATAAAGAGGGWTDDGSVVRLTTSTDKVGIGTSSPETYSKLHIVVPRTQTFDRVTIECPRDSNGFGIELKQPGGYWRLGQNVGNGWNDYFTITNNISPYYRLTILSDGKVGIGTVDAAYKLDVRGDRIQLKEDATGDSIAMRTDGAAVDLSFGGANLYVQSSTAGEHILLNPTTNSYVGIGTTNPGTKLDVTSSSGTAIRTVTTSASGWALEAKAKEAGGYFLDTDDSAYARCGYGGYGVQAQGNSAGGCFKDKNGSGEAWVGTDHQGGWESGIDAYGNAWGGGFTDLNDGGWAWVAYYDNKIYGPGSNDFVQNHPHNKDQVIVYASPEGDEVATYTRGTAHLINGEARVTLGETFKWVTNPDIGLTAHLTPRGDCKGLYVASLTTSEMTVKELQSGTSDVVFDYIVYGLRIGFEEASTVREKIKEAYIPSMAHHRERYNRYPELRHFNALERFREMNAQIGKPFDLGASRVLRDAIHEFDPMVDKLPEPLQHK